MLEGINQTVEKLDCVLLECILGVTWADILLGGEAEFQHWVALEWFIPFLFQSFCLSHGGFSEISREVDYYMSVLYHQKLWSDMIKNCQLRQFFEVNVGEKLDVYCRCMVQ